MPADSSGGSDLSGSVAGLAALAGVNLGDESGNTEEAIAILESRLFVRDFIVEKVPLSALFPDDWDASAQTWRQELESPPTLNDGVRYFLEDVMVVRRLTKGQALKIGITWRDRELAAQWANELIDRLNATMRERALQSAEQSLSYLRSELERVTVVEVRQGIFGLIEEQVKRVMLANVTPQFAFKIIDPAVAPDEDDYHSPRLILMLLGGVFFGGALGAFMAFILAWRKGQL